MATRGQGAIRAGRAFVELFADDSQMQRQLRGAEARLRAFGNSIDRMSRPLFRVGTAITAPLLAAAEVFRRVGDNLDKLSQRTGVSVEALSELGFAAEQSGSDLNALGQALFRMQRRVDRAARGTGPAAEALERLGFSAEALARMSPEEQFREIADRLSSVGDSGQAAQLAFEIFGDSARGLMPLLMQGAGGIDTLRRRARELGITIDADAARSAAAFTDDLNILRQVLRAVTMQIGSSLMPILTDLVQKATDNAAEAREWVSENHDLIRSIFTIGGTALAAAAVLKTLSFTIGSITTIMGGATASTKAFGAVLGAIAAHPFIAGGVAVGGILVGIGIAARNRIRELTALEDQMQRTREAGDKMREGDRDRISRLEELADKEQLNSAQMFEAAKLIEQLEERYGSLGIEIDQATGRLKGFTHGLQEANEQMRAEEIKQLSAEAREIQQELLGLNDELIHLERLAGDAEGFIFDPRGRRMIDAQEEISRLNAQIDDAMDRLGESTRRFRELHVNEERTPAEPDRAVGTDEPPEDDPALVARVEQVNRRLRDLRIRSRREGIEQQKALIRARYDDELREAEASEDEIERLRTRSLGELEIEYRHTNDMLAAIALAREKEIAEIERREADRRSEEVAALQRDTARLRAELIEDEHKREITLINQRYDHELQRAQDNEAAIEQLQRQRMLEIEQAQRRQEEREAAERERIAEADRAREQRIAELEIRTQFDGLDEELEILRLRKRIAIEEARARGENVDLVRREFELLKEQARLRGQAVHATRVSSVPLFDARNIRQQLGAAMAFAPAANIDEDDKDEEQRIAEATEQSATTLGRMLTTLERALPLKFT